MAEVLRSWIITIVSTAAFCALIITVTPKGRVYGAIKLICGLSMIIAIVSPLIDLDFSAYSEKLMKYGDSARELTDGAEEYGDKLNRTFIEDKCAAYILDKAENCGVYPDEVSVAAEWSMDGYWYPVSAYMRCDCSDELRNRLSGVIEAELGISEERQVWSCG